MRPEHISDALGQLSDEILEEADRARTAPRRRKWPVWTAAACLCAVLAGTLLLPRLGGRPVVSGGGGGDLPLDPDSLPLLEISMESGGMGFEGPIGYNFSELDNGNPWREEMVFETLPVYRNGSYSPVGEPHGLSAKETEQLARTAAQAIGMEITSLERVRDGYFTSGVTRVQVLGEGVRIEAEANGTVTVWFDDGLSLPDGYSFTHCDTSDQEAEEALDYLIDRYAGLLNFRLPQKLLRGDRDIYGRFNRDYHVYDAAGDDVEDMLNYTFRYAQFAPDDHGDLMLIRLRDGLAAAEKIGDYPLITLEEARTALLAGEFITTVPYDFPGEDHVYGGELVYRGSRQEQVFIPYYRFYADVSHEFPNWDNGLKNFGAYYVPAVQHQYLKPGWEWDGSFN